MVPGTEHCIDDRKRNTTSEGEASLKEEDQIRNVSKKELE